MIKWIKKKHSINFSISHDHERNYISKRNSRHKEGLRRALSQTCRIAFQYGKIAFCDQKMSQSVCLMQVLSSNKDSILMAASVHRGVR